MGKFISKFIEEFQDMYVTKKTTVTSFTGNLSSIETNIINQQLDSLVTQLEELGELSKNASKELLEEHKKLLEILENKVEYVSDISNMFLYLNSFYDMNNLVDLKDYNLREYTGTEGVVYNNTQKGLTLKSTSVNYKPIKSSTIVNKVVTFYNTNLSMHSGIILSSPVLDILVIDKITIYKDDGTTLILNVDGFSNNSYYITHDLLSSVQIEVSFNLNHISNTQAYMESLELELIDYKYIKEGSITLAEEGYTSSSMFNLIYDCNLPNKTYANIDLTVTGLDINDNIINTMVVTLPLSSPLVCKRLDNLDWNNVSELTGIYVNNHYSNKKKLLSRDFLESRDNKNEIYVIFKSKINHLNNSYSILNNQAIKIKNKNIKYLNIAPTIELFSFNENVAPLVSMLSGAIKHE